MESSCNSEAVPVGPLALRVDGAEADAPTGSRRRNVTSDPWSPADETASPEAAFSHEDSIAASGAALLAVAVIRQALVDATAPSVALMWRQTARRFLCARGPLDFWAAVAGADPQRIREAIRQHLEQRGPIRT